MFGDSINTTLLVIETLFEFRCFCKASSMGGFDVSMELSHINVTKQNLDDNPRNLIKVQSFK